ncbi:MAG: hypothetical protein J3R72DRAFT_424962 [Linnemannia gamsii]|nr:MAG: hypothetical protein J3R72DRAFT_424962 [Linnemannia gamsii]
MSPTLDVRPGTLYSFGSSCNVQHKVPEFVYDGIFPIHWNFALNVDGVLKALDCPQVVFKVPWPLTSDMSLRVATTFVDAAASESTCLHLGSLRIFDFARARSMLAKS